MAARAHAPAPPIPSCCHGSTLPPHASNSVQGPWASEGEAPAARTSLCTTHPLDPGPHPVLHRGRSASPRGLGVCPVPALPAPRAPRAAVNPGVSLRHSRCSWRKGRIFISSSLHFMREGLSGLVSGHPPAWRSVTVVCLCQQWVWRAVSGSASIHPLAPLPEVVSLVWDLACNILPNKQTNTPSCVISVQRACRPDHLSLSMAPTTCAPVPFGHLGAQPAWGHWSELPSTRHSQPDCSDQGLWFFLSLPCPGVSRPEPPRRALEALGQGSGAPGWEVSLILGPEPLPRAGPKQPLLADLTSHPAGSQG